MSMTKSDIVGIVSENPEIMKYGLPRKEVAMIVSKLIDKLKDNIKELDSGDRIELRGFGTFGVKLRKSRIARNPKTGEQVKVPARKSVYFKAGREMKGKVKGKK